MLRELRRECGEKATLAPWRLHDLRRTFSSQLSEHLSVPPHVVEACLNHVSGAAKRGVAGTYNQATYAAERRVALERWADHVEGLASGRKSRVLDIRVGRKAKRGRGAS
jgi:hypothetical protein